MLTSAAHATLSARVIRTVLDSVETPELIGALGVAHNGRGSLARARAAAAEDISPVWSDRRDERRRAESIRREATSSDCEIGGKRRTHPIVGVADVTLWTGAGVVARVVLADGVGSARVWLGALVNICGRRQKDVTQGGQMTGSRRGGQMTVTAGGVNSRYTRQLLGWAHTEATSAA